jgi:hypothetical protein
LEKLDKQFAEWRPLTIAALARAAQRAKKRGEAKRIKARPKTSL